MGPGLGLRSGKDPDPSLRESEQVRPDRSAQAPSPLTEDALL